jgi:selenocysteine lyase/cysteine desulfurase
MNNRAGHSLLYIHCSTKKVNKSSMPIHPNPAQLRADTPGCEKVIHFNNAGASLMPLPVLNEIQQYLLLEMSMGGYEAARASESKIRSFYEQAAALLNTKPENIAYTVNATDAFSRALSSIAFEPGDLIVTSDNDYISNQITFLSLRKRLGIELIRCESQPAGEVDVDALRSLFRKRKPKLFALSHMPTNSGLIQPAEACGKLSREYDVLFLLDACQTIGQLSLDVTQLHCDFLSATGRKFLRGPRGTGLLFVSDRILQSDRAPLFLDMRGADWVGKEEYQLNPSARRFEDWETAYALQVGLGKAIEYACRLGLDFIEQSIKSISHEIRNRLKQLPNLQLLDNGRHLGGIISTYLPSVRDPVALRNYLQAKGINTTVQMRNDALIDFDRKSVPWSLRISPHYYNTMEEVDKLMSALHEAEASFNNT